MEKNCKTCIDNDNGFCDQREILVEDEDPCNKCSEYGGDYYRDENGEIICRCLECPDGPYQDQENDTRKEKHESQTEQEVIQ